MSTDATVMKKLTATLTFVFITSIVNAQVTGPCQATSSAINSADSSDLLDEVLVQAYEANRKLIRVPAPVSVINHAQLNRFNNISLVPALNTVPGVRMEERSPGSYRL